MMTHDLLVSEGYKLIDDAWDKHRRLTYLHDDDVTRPYLAKLAQSLLYAGWKIDRSKLRAFHHPQTGNIIELEPGGSETTGHFLHHIGEAIVSSSVASPIADNRDWLLANSVVRALRAVLIDHVP